MKPIESTSVSPPLELEVSAALVAGVDVAGSLETSALVLSVVAAVDEVVDASGVEVFELSSDDEA